MKMPFGKYKGADIDTLSYAYVVKLLDNVPIKSKALRLALEERRDTAPKRSIRPGGMFHEDLGTPMFSDSDDDYDWMWDDF